MESVNLVPKVEQAVRNALHFIERTGIDTYEPLDLSGLALAQRFLAVPTRLGTLLRRGMWGVAYLAPQAARRAFGVQPKAMHSGVANLVSLYIELGGDENFNKAKELLGWLQTHATVEEHYVGWGFPFPWKQKLLVLAGTPIGHTTMTCANAFLKYYRSTGDEAALQVARSACEFFHYGLRHTHRSDNSIAVSYTPLDQTQVINIQADIGSLLIRLGDLTREKRHISLGLKLIQCVLETQNSDGSWYYYAPEGSGQINYIDTHHAGMILSGLAEVYESPSLPEGMKGAINSAVGSGAGYFFENLFTDEGIPKYYNDSLYPIETYNFAQSIISFLDIKCIVDSDQVLTRRFDERLSQVITYLVDRMQTRSGGFLYRRTKLVKQDLGSLRWANALATFALVRWLQTESFKRQGSIEQSVLQSA